jgi:sugar/nucleoside kinase (ribokinase family)
MSSKRIIVGIGEALRVEQADRVSIGGLAANVAMAAHRLGHAGLTISRIGQDSAGDELLKRLRENHVNLDHLQTDPDLPTGRLVVRSLAGKMTHTLTPQAAFDNLQWDFDLVDVGHDADAVVFGELARRGGQTRSVIKQFLAGCGSAIRMYDATNRSDDSRLDRGLMRSALEFAEVVVADLAALQAMVPVWKSGHVEDAARSLMDESRLAATMIVERHDGDELMTVCGRDGTVKAARAHPQVQHEVALVAMVLGLLEGLGTEACVNQAVQVATSDASNAATPAQPTKLSDS